MSWYYLFAISALMGIGLAMDAFSVSLANGLHEPEMSGVRQVRIAGVYAFFQFLMPMAGWLCVHTIVTRFTAFTAYTRWIALFLLGGIGLEMIFEGLRERRDAIPEEERHYHTTGAMTLAVQGVATSIDALSVGFTIAEYGALAAFASSLVIATVTFLLCLSGLEIGRRFGTKYAGSSSVLGGVILVLIGVLIFV